MTTAAGRVEGICKKLVNILGVTNDIFKKSQIYIYYIITSLIADIKNNKKFVKKCEFSKFKMSKTTMPIQMLLWRKFSNLDHNKKHNHYFKIPQLVYNEETRRDYEQNKEDLESEFYRYVFETEVNVYTDWLNVDCEIEERTYNNDENKAEHSFFLIKVYIPEMKDDDIVSSTRSLMNTNRFKKKLDPCMVKNLNKQIKESEINAILEDNRLRYDHHTGDKKDKKNKSKSAKSKVVMNSESVGSGSSFSALKVYYKYFLKKFKEKIQKTTNNPIVTFFGFVLICCSCVCYGVFYNISLNDYSSLEKLIDLYTNVYDGFTDMNCVEKNYNSLLLRKYATSSSLKSSQFYADMMLDCLKEIQKKNTRIKNLYSLPILFDFEDHRIFSNFTVELFNNSLTSSIRIQVYDFIDFFSDQIQTDLITLRNSFYNKGFLLDTELSKLMKQYYAKISTQLFIFINTTDILHFRTEIDALVYKNLGFLLVQVVVVLVCFIVIIPIFSKKKREQSEILESFFLIKREDIVEHLLNCRQFITSNTNGNVGNKSDIDMINSLNKSNDAEGAIGEGKDKKNEDEVSDDDSNKLGENLPNVRQKKKVSKSTKKHSVANKNKFPITQYMTQLVLKISLLCFLLLIFPIAHFFTFSAGCSMTKSFVELKSTIDNFSYHLMRHYIESLNVYVKLTNGETLTESDFNVYISSKEETELYQLQFKYIYSQALTMGLSKSNDLSYLLNINVCDVLQKYNIFIENCSIEEAKLNQKGFSSVINLLNNKLNEFYTKIVVQRQVIRSTTVQGFINTDMYIIPDTMYSYFYHSSFQCIILILITSINEYSQLIHSLLLLYLVLFIFLEILVFIFGWNKLNDKLTNIELDTYRIYSTLPVKFLKHEYVSIIKFMRNIND